jgi:CD2 antigen cytoplasmic tail-binding protein 2
MDRKPRAVRFAPGTAEAPDNDAHDDQPPRKKNTKRPRPERPNADEIDDVDDWRPEEEDEDDDDAAHSQQQLLAAKRQRRLQRQSHDGDEEDDDTHIDNQTSLAAEGVEIEPFHMEQEQSDGSGFFDGETYVFRNRDAGEEPDAWLDSLEENQYAARKGKQKSVPTAPKPPPKTTSNSANDIDSWTEEQLYAKILPLVSDTETVMKAIVRYGNLIKQNKSAAKGMAQTSLDQLVEAASALMLKGNVDIYQTTRNQLVALLSTTKSTTTAQLLDEEKEQPLVQWEYQGSQDGQVHGPYSTSDMVEWTRAGYFTGASAVQIRAVRDDESTTLEQDLLHDLMGDDDDEANTNGGQQVETLKVRGEWMQSDQVDFSKYR